MSKKLLTMADKINENIDRIKSLLEVYSKQDIEEIKYKKEFMEKQLEEQVYLYNKYKEKNEPYYEPYTYEYYKNYFLESRDDYLELQDKFIIEVSFLADKGLNVSQNKPSKKLKILEDIIRAYNEVKSLSDIR